MKQEKKHTIALNNVTIGYDGKKALLENVSADVFGGEMIALVGRNGSGKSTLLRAIAALKKCLKGEVLLEGEVNSAIPVHRFSKLLSFVESGSNQVENLTTYELVSTGRHPYTNWWGKITAADHQKIEEAIGFVGMMDFIHSPVNTLSDGERQRVMIARALAQETTILLLDEPTAFLDLPNKFEIINVLYKLKESGKSVVYSTHDLETAFLFADKCWVIHQHKLINGGVEDLGIKDVYNEIFRESNVKFDGMEMKFIPNRESRGEVYLSANEGLERSWTVRALERIGFELAFAKNSNIPEIALSGEGNALHWTINHEGNTFEFYSLYDMSNYLKYLV